MTDYIDNTILTNWKKCRLAAWLTYGKGWTTHRDIAGIGTPTNPRTPRPPNLKLLWGTAAHEAEAVWLGTRDTVAAALTFERLYRPWSEHPSPDDDRYGWDNSRDIIAAYLYHQSSLPSTFTPADTWVERHIEVPLKAGPTPGDPPAIMFVSRPDAIGTVAGQNGYYTRETKTTGQRLGEDWASQWSKSSQLTSQIWAVAHATGQPINGAYVNAIAVTRLPRAENFQCKIHKQPKHECRLNHATFAVYGPFTRSPIAIDTWRREALELAEEFLWYRNTYELEQLAAVPEDGQFDAGGACRFCDWREWCVAGKDPALVERVATHNAWDPQVGAKGRPSARADTSHPITLNERP